MQKCKRILNTSKQLSDTLPGRAVDNLDPFLDAQPQGQRALPMSAEQFPLDSFYRLDTSTLGPSV